MPATAARRYDAVICDIDGCLSPESSAPMDLDALASIRQHNVAAQAQGDRPVVTLCSGRPVPFVEAMCRLLGNESLPAIGENGVWLWDPRDNGFEMDPAITAEHLDAVGQLSRWGRLELAAEGLVEQPGKAASLSFYHAEPARLPDLLSVVAARCAREGWPLRVTQTWFYINCDLEHVSKATGVARWIERCGLDAARLAGIGDTPADKGIREHVAFFGAPANAHPDLKPVADHVAAAAETHGVLEILERLDG